MPDTPQAAKARAEAAQQSTARPAPQPPYHVEKFWDAEGGPRRAALLYGTVTVLSLLGMHFCSDEAPR